MSYPPRGRIDFPPACVHLIETQLCESKAKDFARAYRAPLNEGGFQTPAVGLGAFCYRTAALWVEQYKRQLPG